MREFDTDFQLSRDDAGESIEEVMPENTSENETEEKLSNRSDHSTEDVVVETVDPESSNNLETEHSHDDADDDEMNNRKADDDDLECPTQATDDPSIDVVDSEEVVDDEDVNMNKMSKHDDFKTPELSQSQQLAKTRFLLDPKRRIEALSEQRYHLPNNNWVQDWLQYFANNHPLFGICFHHADHPIGWPMRIMCFFASIVFGLAITNAFWLWARNDEENSKHLFTVNTGDKPGSNFTRYVVDVNDDNDVDVTKDIILLWTLGGLVHGMFDNLIWTLSICACCNPGGKYEMLAKYKKFGIGLLSFFILIIIAVTSLSVVLRGVMEEEEESQDVKELRSAGVFDDQVDLKPSSKENYEFLMSYFVEVALEFAVYFPLIGSLLFSGTMACFKLPQFRGRPYEVEEEEKELEEILEHPERYLQEDWNEVEDDDVEEETNTKRSVWGVFKRTKD